MSGVHVSINDSELQSLAACLRKMNEIRFDAVVKKNITQILNRARAGGTPVDSGELRLSSSATDDEMGYTKEYAPHVEYGHRTLDGGWVEGQRYLQGNVSKQKETYKQDLLNAIRKG